MKKIAYLFPGQGSQFPGMGKDFFENFKDYRLVLEEGNDILRRDLKKIILEGSEEEISKTINSQPAIFLVSYGILSVLKKAIPHLTPFLAAGLSLGEYTALTSAEAMSFSDALRLVDKRARAMSEACERHTGTMAAILGLSQKDVESLVKDARMPDELFAANFNSPGQTVISGTVNGVKIGSDMAKERGAKKVIPLAVQGAFHSGLMKSAENTLRDAVSDTHFQNPKIPVIMNVSAAAPSSVEEMRDLLVKQVTHPVRWQESIEKMEQDAPELYLEIGCGKTLAGMNKRIGTRAQTLSIEKIADIDALQKEME